MIIPGIITVNVSKWSLANPNSDFKGSSRVVSLSKTSSGKVNLPSEQLKMQKNQNVWKINLEKRNYT